MSVGPQRLRLLTGVFLLACLAASPATAERLLTRTYTVADGLASDRVGFVAADRDGFLWMCTANGLSRFDGSAFVTYRSRSGLPDSVVNHFLQTRDGARWVATNGGGIARMVEDPGQTEGRIFTPFRVGPTAAGMRINRLFETSEGELLAGTDGGLFRSPSGRGDPSFQPLPLGVEGTADDRLQIWSFAEDARGGLWVGTSAGLVYRPRNGRRRHFSVAPAQGADHVQAIVIDDAGRLWLGHDRGLLVWVPVTAPGDSPLLDAAVPCVASPAAPREPPAAAQGVAGGSFPVVLPERPGEACRWAHPDAERADRGVYPRLRTPEGTLWMASHDGLVAFDGAHFRIYGELQGVPAGGSVALARDSGGDLWVSTSAGLLQVLLRGFLHYTANEGLIGGPVYRVFEGSDGTLYAVTRSGHVHRFTEDRWVGVRPNLPRDAGRAGRSRYGAVLLDHAGQWWVGSGEGLFRFPRVETLEALERIAPVAHYTTADGLAGDDVWQLHEDRHGDIWIASRVPGPSSLARWRRDTERLERFGSDRGLPAGRAVLRFADDRAGGLWIGFWDGGLARFDGTSFRDFPPGDAVPRGPVSALLVDGDGSLWAAIRETLVHAADAAKPEFVVHPGLPEGSEDILVALGDAGADGLYLGSALGLARLDPDRGIYRILGTGAPFATLQLAFRDSRGRSWFGTDDGLLRYDPQSIPEGASPRVWIEGLRVAGVAHPVPPMGARSLAPLRLSSAPGQIEIEYAGLAHGTDQPLRFQARLEGVDEGWGAPIDQRNLRYAGLGPGSYRFEVRAVTAAGQASPRPASVTFTIPPPVWRRPWFLAVAVAALAALLAVGHQLRVRRLVELERVRTHIATDLHDDLGASLAQISVLSEVGRRQLDGDALGASQRFTEIGEVARELVSTVGDIAYAVDPGRGALTDLAARVRRVAGELLEPAGIAFELEVGAGCDAVELSSAQRRHLLACLKEALHNTVRHADPGAVEVAFLIDGGQLTIRVSDDGSGFEPEGAARSAVEAGHRGLENMKRRLTELGGDFEASSRPGEGTRLTLRVPL